MNNRARLVNQSEIIETLEDCFFEFETAERASRAGVSTKSSPEARIDQTISLMYRLKLINAEEFQILDQRIEQIKEQIELECATGTAEAGKRERL